MADEPYKTVAIELAVYLRPILTKASQTLFKITKEGTVAFDDMSDVFMAGRLVIRAVNSIETVRHVNETVRKH